jgi:hypothetical protein
MKKYKLHALRGDDQTSLEPIGRCQVGKGHEVGALVLGLVQERLDPPTVILEAPQGLEVREGTADHPGNCSHCFQNDGAMAVAAPKEPVGQKPQKLHAPKSETVGGIRGCTVIDLQLALGLIVPRHRLSFLRDWFVQRTSELARHHRRGDSGVARWNKLVREGDAPAAATACCARRSLTAATSTDMLAGFLT